MSSNLVSSFAGLRDFASDELARASGELQLVGEPRVFEFRIDGIHMVNGSAVLASLLNEIKDVAASDATTIYYLRPVDTSDGAIALIRQFFFETKQKGDGRSRDNNRSSETLYVGSSRKMPTRLREHLGFCSRSTYALKLSEWYPGADIPLQLICAVYPAGTSATVIGALEDALWERLHPMFGRKGAR